MFARATAAILPEEQAIFFDLYVDDVPAKHAALHASGLTPGTSHTRSTPPRGHFRIVDPDGYALMITHADR